VVKNTNTSSDEEEAHTVEPVKNVTPANAEQRSNMSTPVGQYQFNSIFVPKPPPTKPTVQYQVQTGQDPKASFSFIMPSSFSLEKESQPVQFTPETSTFLQYPLSVRSQLMSNHFRNHQRHSRFNNKQQRFNSKRSYYQKHGTTIPLTRMFQVLNILHRNHSNHSMKIVDQKRHHQ
jgi:hypothetical protein